MDWGGVDSGEGASYQEGRKTARQSLAGTHTSPDGVLVWRSIVQKHPFFGEAARQATERGEELGTVLGLLCSLTKLLHSTAPPSSSSETSAVLEEANVFHALFCASPVPTKVQTLQHLSRLSPSSQLVLRHDDDALDADENNDVDDGSFALEELRRFTKAWVAAVKRGVLKPPWDGSGLNVALLKPLVQFSARDIARVTDW